MPQLIIEIDDADVELLPYYAENIGVNLADYATSQEQIDAIADTLKRKYRLEAINLKAKTAGQAADLAVREQYS